MPAPRDLCGEERMARGWGPRDRLPVPPGLCQGPGGSAGGAQQGPCLWHVSRLGDVQLMVLGKGVGIWGFMGLFSPIGLEEMT